MFNLSIVDVYQKAHFTWLAAATRERSAALTYESAKVCTTWRPNGRTDIITANAAVARPKIPGFFSSGFGVILRGVREEENAHTSSAVAEMAALFIICLGA